MRAVLLLSLVGGLVVALVVLGYSLGRSAAARRVTPTPSTGATGRVPERAVAPDGGPRRQGADEGKASASPDDEVGDWTDENPGGHPRGTVVANVRTGKYHIVGVTRARLPSLKNSRVYPSREAAERDGFIRSRR